MSLEPLDCGHLTMSQLHSQMAAMQNEVGSNPASQCGKRRPCNGCCHKNVNIFRDEAKLLLPYLPDDKGIGYLKGVTTRDDLDRAKQRRACVFLNTAGKCGVYDIRPAICRAYYVTSNPKHCHSFTGLSKIKGKQSQGVMFLMGSWWKAHPEQKPKLMEEHLLDLLLEQKPKGIEE